MAHEITNTDGLVLTKTRAWHGLGTIVQDAPTPLEALKIAGMDWTVGIGTLTAQFDDDQLPVNDRRVIVRRDTKKILGVVGDGYTPIQNEEVAEFCMELAEGGDTVKIESAGSIRGGAKIWFLLQGESFSVRTLDDEIKPYICVSNGHDGLTAFRCTPTTVRVVCSNTLHMVIPKKEREGVISRTAPAAFVCHHTGSIKKRVEEVKAALGLYNRSLDTTREVLDALAACELKKEQVQNFFLQVYTQDFGAVPVNPKTEKQEKARNKALVAMDAMLERFHDERKIAGATAWNAMNAYTGYTQNDLKPRTKSAQIAQERKNYSKLFGTDATRAHHALNIALGLVT